MQAIIDILWCKARPNDCAHAHESSGEITLKKSKILDASLTFWIDIATVTMHPRMSCPPPGRIVPAEKVSGVSDSMDAGVTLEGWAGGGGGVGRLIMHTCHVLSTFMKS